MAQPIFMNVPENFDLSVFAKKLESACQSKGYLVQTMVTDNSAMLTLNKDMDGLNKWLGLGEGVVVNCTLSDNRLTLNFMNEEWTNKIVALVIGWFCCIIPFITGIVGIIRQVNLPKNVGSDAMMLAPQSIAPEMPADAE